MQTDTKNTYTTIDANFYAFLMLYLIADFSDVICVKSLTLMRRMLSVNYCLINFIFLLLYIYLNFLRYVLELWTHFLIYYIKIDERYERKVKKKGN